MRLSQVVQVYVYSGIRDTETAKRCQSKMPAAPSKRFTDLFISVATSTESKCKQRSRSCRNYVLLIEQRIRFESICRRKRYLLRSTSFNLRGGVQSFKLFVNAARLKLAIENRNYFILFPLVLYYIFIQSVLLRGSIVFDIIN